MRLTDSVSRSSAPEDERLQAATEELLASENRQVRVCAVPQRFVELDN